MSDTTKKIKIKVDADMSSFKKVGHDFKKAFEEDMKVSFDGKKFYEGLKKVGNTFLQGIKNIFSQAWKELDSMLGYSKLSNAETRNLALGYGFTGSEAYGYNKALDILGFDSMEDLMYANEQEIGQFRELFQKYTDKYNKLYDSGFFTTLQEYEVEMAEFEEDLKIEVVEFLIDNKELIKQGMNALMELSEKVLEFISSVGRVFKTEESASSSRLARSSDIISNYQNTSTNVNIDNTYNNVSSSDREWLNNVGQGTYAQIIKVLKGGY